MANCNEFLITGLKKQILESKKNKILIVLHTYTSHGPTYYKKYPKQFEVFTPVCTSVELTKCNQDELLNAYDNTIVYTDYMLATIIEKLKELKDYKSSMIYISDHGESLGNAKKPKNSETASQHHIFHSVLDFLDIESPVYDEKMTIFEK